MSMREIVTLPSNKEDWPNLICDTYDIDRDDECWEEYWEEVTNRAYYLAINEADNEGNIETVVCIFPFTHLGGNEYEINWLFDSSMPLVFDCSLEFINRMICIQDKEYPWRDCVINYHDKNNFEEPYQKVVDGLNNQQ
jgi:hypothetical protein